MSELNQNTKTLHQVKLDIAQSRGIPHIPDSYSTLNEAYNIGGITPPSVGYPETKYIMVGNGGSRIDVGLNASPVKKTLKHKPTDAVLYNAIPFLMVPTDDISPTERANYRLRVLEVVNGVSYFSYYVKVIETLTPNIMVKIVEQRGGEVVSSTDYIPSPESLAPTPILLSNVSENTVYNRDLRATSMDDVVLTKTDLENLKASITIKHGLDDIEKFTISELAVIQSWTEEVTSTLSNVTATYNELRCGQIATYVLVMQNILYGATEWTIEIGLENSTSMPPNL